MRFLVPNPIFLPSHTTSRDILLRWDFSTPPSQLPYEYRLLVSAAARSSADLSRLHFPPLFLSLSEPPPSPLRRTNPNPESFAWRFFQGQRRNYLTRFEPSHWWSCTPLRFNLSHRRMAGSPETSSNLFCQLELVASPPPTFTYDDFSLHAVLR